MQETCIAPVLTLLDRPGVSAANFHIILCGLLPGGMPTPVGPGLCGMKRAGALRPRLARAMFAQASRRHSANSWTETSRCGGADLLSWRSPLGRGPLFTQVRGIGILRSSAPRRATGYSLWNIKDLATTLTHVPSPKEG